MGGHDSGGSGCASYTPRIPAWLDNSYTTLIAEVAGIVVATLLLRSLLGRRPALGTAIPITVALLMTLLLVPGVWGALRGLDAVRDGLLLAPGINEREKCLVDGGSPDKVAVARFVNKNVPPQSRITASGVPQVCFQLAVLPRMMVRPDQPHDYSLYTSQVPSDVRAKLRAERKLDPSARTVLRFDGDTDAVLVKVR